MVSSRLPVSLNHETVLRCSSDIARVKSLAGALFNCYKAQNVSKRRIEAVGTAAHWNACKAIGLCNRFLLERFQDKHGESAFPKTALAFTPIAVDKANEDDSDIPTGANPVELRKRTYQFELHDVSKLYCMEDPSVRQALWVAPDDDILFVSGKTRFDKFAEVLRYRVEESLQVHTHVAGAYPMDRFLRAALRLESDLEQNRLIQDKRNRRFRHKEAPGVLAYVPCPIRVNADMGIMQLVAMTLPLDEIMRDESKGAGNPSQV
ncbi:hypothetical protein FOL47_009136 [Perkinsus chesapeaki]|uniref:Uncharacterized protein n=1 Tax=Perkinsus chesapeaki TaxID=330153 RepID=A0A7J6LA75_PERCH|nr:hypothetical protein FOL47_009136 [Perkinsus chesapeaki]